MSQVPIDIDSSTEAETTLGRAAQKTKGTLALVGLVVSYVFLIAPARAAGQVEAEARLVGKWTYRATQFLVGLVLGYVLASIMSAVLQTVFDSFQERIENDPRALAGFVALQFAVGIAAGIYIALFTSVEFAAYRKRLKELADKHGDQMTFDEVEADD